MSNTLEYDSEGESSQSRSSEYLSREEPENDRTQIILVNREEEFTFLNIQFPMPTPYPHLYIQLKELMTTVTTTPESYEWITNISGNPHRALGYILYHFNIDRVSRSIRAYRPYNPIRFTTQPTWYHHSLKLYSTITIEPDNSYKMPLQKNG